MIELYKKNQNNNVIFWNITKVEDNIIINHGLYGRSARREVIRKSMITRSLDAEILSRVNAKQKDGYKSISELADNAPEDILDENVRINYLIDHLPAYSTTKTGFILPMLCKTLEDNKPFEKNGEYLGQSKINGLRCNITPVRQTDLFKPIKFVYHSREGEVWDLEWFDDILFKCLPIEVINFLIDNEASLDGEMYIPNQPVNQVNSIVKNKEHKLHKKIQFWCYDICIENISAEERQQYLLNNLYNYVKDFKDINEHLNNTNQFVVLHNELCGSYSEAITLRNKYISLGFEGLVIRNMKADYGFGKRNNSHMLKFKKIYDGLFKIIDIIPEGTKRAHLPKFVCRNDINDATFECTINLPQYVQAGILVNKDQHIGKNLFVEYRERSGVNQVPFHAKGIKINN